MDGETVQRPIGRRETRKQDRRAGIVAAARRSFLDDGYAATSMSGLLKTLGGSKGTLWGYFRSKEDLFAAVIEDVTLAFRQQLESELVTSGELRSTLVAFCRSFMNKTANPDAVATWRLVVAESGRFPEVGKIFYERVAGHVETALTAYLTQQVVAGQLRNEDPLAMAQLLISMCATQQNKLLWGVQLDDFAEKDAEASRFADYFLRLFAAA
jgi:TetR/AcrR family transcriptional regulator, mexJK operon transcriptional repressor